MGEREKHLCVLNHDRSVTVRFVHPFLETLTMWMRPQDRRPISVAVTVERREEPGLLFRVFSNQKH